MRVSTNQIYNTGKQTIQDLNSSLVKIQQQMGAGRNILSPSDDPVASSRALTVSQSKAFAEQMLENQSDASVSMQLSESVITSVANILQNVREKIVAAGNGSYSYQQLQSIATDLDQQFDMLVDLANTADGSGRFIFAGGKSEVKPFVVDSTGAVSFVGDDSPQFLQLSASRMMAVSEIGSTVFQSILSGNGTFSTSAGSGNAGSGLIDVGSVVNASLWDGGTYQISFGAGGTSYTVQDNAIPPNTITTGTYAAGTDITFKGIAVNISGNPVAGDTFDVTPSRNQSIFKSVKDFVNSLQSITAATPNAGAKVQNAISSALINVDNGLTNILRVQASIGSRLNEIDSFQASTEDMKNLYEDELSSLVDLNYTEVITRLSRDKVQLEAAQQSFLKITQLSLFSML